MSVQYDLAVTVSVKFLCSVAQNPLTSTRMHTHAHTHTHTFLVHIYTHMPWTHTFPVHPHMPVLILGGTGGQITVSSPWVYPVITIRNNTFMRVANVYGFQNHAA